MQKLFQIPLLLALAGILLLITLFLLDQMGVGRFVIHILALKGLLMTGTSIILLRRSSGIIKYMGFFSAAAGFILWTMAVYKFIDLKYSWNIGLAFISFGLISGIYSQFKNSTPWLKWTGTVACVLFLAAMAGILFRVENIVLSTIGTIGLAVFSIIAVIGTVMHQDPNA